MKRLGGRRPRFNSRKGRIFLFATPDSLWDPPYLLFSRYRSSFVGVKWQGPESNYFLRSSTLVKNTWSHASAPPYACMSWCLAGTPGTFLLHICKCYASGPDSAVSIRPPLHPFLLTTCDFLLIAHPVISSKSSTTTHLWRGSGGEEV
jgi:hypothetical protein